MATSIDPIKRELIKNALVSVADNIMLAVVRTARSTVVKNNMDFSASICDTNGQMVAQGLAVPVHLGATMPALKGCVDYFGADIFEGDILASNDPYAGGSHLNDIFMFKPVFFEGRRVAFLGLILHHTDMGGRVAGGNAADSNEIYQEGLRIPPTKILERGVANQTLLRIIEHNVRVPERNQGDLKAQIAALNLGEKELLRLLADYDIDEFCTYMTELMDYTERLTRAGIAALPDGEYQFTDWNDDDGIGSGPVRLVVKLTVKGETLTADFTGTAPQTGGALHTNYWFTASCTFAAIRSVFDTQMPNNAGFYRPITIIAPEGCWVNPVFPAALGARGQGGHRVRHVVLGALAQMLPDRMPACVGGSEFAIVIAGYRANRKPFLHLDFHNNSGLGGGPDRDGQDAGPYCLGNTANMPVELIEAESPILMDEYGFLPDTGGPGKYRGALALVRSYRVLADSAMVQLRSDRERFAPWGLFGGKPGAKARSFLNFGTDREQRLPSKFMMQVRKDDVFRGEMAASGGYGDPLERDPAAVAEDIKQEKLTIAHAREEYAVIVHAGSFEVDWQATAQLRAQRTAKTERIAHIS
jgi:N-methylhydantoinase B